VKLRTYFACVNVIGTVIIYALAGVTGTGDSVRRVVVDAVLGAEFLALSFPLVFYSCRNASFYRTTAQDFGPDDPPPATPSAREFRGILLVVTFFILFRTSFLFYDAAVASVDGSSCGLNPILGCSDISVSEQVIVGLYYVIGEIVPCAVIMFSVHRQLRRLYSGIILDNWWKHALTH